MLLIIGIIIAAIIGGVVLIAAGAGEGVYNKGQKPGFLIAGHLLVWPAALFTVVLLFLWPIQYFTSLAAVNEMQAFQDTRTTIIGAIEKAQDVEIEGAGSVDSLVDLTYQQQSRSYTDLVADCRDRVADYNENYRRTKALKEVPFFGRMRVGVPDSLKAITGDFCTGGE